MKRTIYADHAATTPLMPEAFEAMRPYLQENYYNPSTQYSAARKARKAVLQARTMIAKLIGADPSEIFFTSGGTESDNWAIKGALFGSGKKKAVITDVIEHHAVLRSCTAIERMGFLVSYLTPDSDGTVQPASLRLAITPETSLVSVMLANNELGTIQPIQELAGIAHEFGTLFHTDAVQAVGHIPVDVQTLDVDLLSASAHKFGGPKGIGFLYVRHGLKLEPLISGGSQESGMRAGTENIASIVGMSVALERSCHELEHTTKALQTMRMTFIQSMQKTHLAYRLNGSNHCLPGTISLSIKDIEGEMLLHRLDMMGIQVATGSACDSKDIQVSHVLRGIRLPDEYAVGTIRISFGIENTEQDAIEIVKALNEIVRQLD